MKEALETLIADQAGMVARRQLNQHGVDWDAVRNHVAARRWTERTPRVISTTTGPLSWNQWLWLAVLHAGPKSMIGGLTAAAHHGLTGWERDEVTVIVDDELSFEPVDGIDFFRSRRPFSLLLHPRPGLPVCRLEPAVLLHAGYEANTRAAHALVAATVQQRLTTPARMLTWVDQLRPLRRAKPFRATLNDVAGGSQSGAELAVCAMCRRFAIPLPHRQRSRTDRAGKQRWTDCEWDLPDGTVLVLEVDGGFHMDVRHWGDDLKRARRITTRRRIVVRCSAYELRHEAEEVAIDLIALGLPGRVPDNAA
ncbi:hypothetical protein ACT8ZV_20990 [Nocardioides sp. MAHUQ-72]|uniref:hypothetical protein n=1 Tax=unclassified Nocardioides TaxID=2615069 RepID=UPI00361ABB26